MYAQSSDDEHKENSSTHQTQNSEEPETPTGNNSHNNDINNDIPLSDDEHIDNVSQNVEKFWEAYSESDDDDDVDTSSDIENYICIDINNNQSQKNERNFKKLSFQKIKNKTFENCDMPLVYTYSSALDILASYIKCHIQIYLEASYKCSFDLNMFMMPCILLSSTCSVLSAYVDSHKYVPIIVASVNGMVAFLLAMINYYKLDAKSEAHKISSYQYSKLKSYIEFTSGEILLFQDPMLTNKQYNTQQMLIWKKNNKHKFSSKKQYKTKKHEEIKRLTDRKNDLEGKIITIIQGKIMEFKKTLKNIQENNKFILPKGIAKKYHNVYNVNIFTYIKNIESYKLFILNELRNVKNEMRFENYYYKHSHRESYHKDIENNKEIIQENINHIRELYQKKLELTREFFELHNGYALIDNMFRQEVKNIQIYKKYWYLFLLQNTMNIMKMLCFMKKELPLHHYDQNQYFIPNSYRNPCHFGYVDKNGVFLLEKIMNYNRKGFI
jgi:hypothetical protein